MPSFLRKLFYFYTGKHCKSLSPTEDGATEIARPDIARMNNVTPARKGENREICFILLEYLIVAF